MNSLKMTRKTPKYSALCSVQPNPSILLKNNITNYDNSSTRGLFRFGLGGFARGGKYGVTEDKNYIDKLRNMNGRGIPAWACSCAPNYYCLSPSASMCAISSNKDEPIKCLDATSVTAKERHLWFLIIIYFGTCIMSSIYLFPKS